MDRLRKLWTREGGDQAGEYRPIGEDDDRSARPSCSNDGDKSRVGRLEYAVFLLLGIAMLWSWNMFLAAAPYFQTRFADAERLLASFQSSIITVSTVTNLVLTAALARLQAKASYPRRVAGSLVLNIASFAVLALLTVAFLDMTAEAYFALLMVLVCLASVAASLCQNGAFALASGLGVGEYTQVIMTGQGIAGVAPCVVQIISVLSVHQKEEEKEGGRGGAAQESPRSACAYFGTAAVVSALALAAFGMLMRRNGNDGTYQAIRSDLDDSGASEDLASSQLSQRKVVGLWQMFVKLKWLAMAIFTDFAVTMQFAVYTQRILSVKDAQTAAKLFQPVAFIPLGFLFWNAGDLAGKMAPAIPLLNISDRPKTVFAASIARLAWIPLYHLCNIDGRGAAVSSDFFYLVIVQFLFGFTGGWLGTTCMMGPSHYVEESEMEAASGLMVLLLVGGLSAGSVLSFASM